MMNENTLNVDIQADTTQFDVAMESLNDATKNFGRTFTSTISQSIRSGKSFGDTLRSLGQKLSDMALNQAMKPIEGLMNNLMGSAMGGIAAGLGGGAGGGIGGGMPSFGGGAGGFSIPGFANGGVFNSSGHVPFAKGGVVSSPTPFNFANRLGVMGEAGPEAVMPLARGRDGRLGVAAQNNASGGMNVTFNVSANDASSFKKSEGQITAMLARAVARGQRSL